MTQPVRLPAIVEEVVEHAPGLRSLELALERPAPRFKPGQFLHLAIDAWEPSMHWPDSRAFSIASNPDLRDRLRLTFSVVGTFTQRMQTLQRGSRVWVKLPYGDFVVESQPGTPVVLVAGGTGITAFSSLLASDAAPAGEVRVLYGVRCPELLAYGSVLANAARKHPHVRCRTFVEERGDETTTRGRLDVDAVLAAAASTSAPQRALYYLSGPPQMIESLTAALVEHTVDRSRIRIDAWS
jgi:nitric oxide dioxygenase